MHEELLAARALQQQQQQQADVIARASLTSTHNPRGTSQPGTHRPGPPGGSPSAESQSGPSAAFPGASLDVARTDGDHGGPNAGPTDDTTGNEFGSEGWGRPATEGEASLRRLSSSQPSSSSRVGSQQTLQAHQSSSTLDFLTRTIESSDVNLAAAAAAAERDERDPSISSTGFGAVLGDFLGGRDGISTDHQAESREYVPSDSVDAGAGSPRNSDVKDEYMRSGDAGRRRTFEALHEVLSEALGPGVTSDMFTRRSSSGGGGSGGGSTAAASEAEILGLAQRLHAIVMRNRLLEAEISELEKEVIDFFLLW